jgi:formamidopyrimidine-DNA glycosylase
VLNYPSDEVLYQARIHPEQYSNTLSDSQIKDLHDALIDVCTIACETFADSSRFPENWLMKHRWNKGKKNANVLPNGEKIIHLKVGGRTSAVVPSVQKKTGPVAGDVSLQDLAEVEEDGEGNEKPKKKLKNGTLIGFVKEEEEAAERSRPSKKRKSTAANGVNEEEKTPKKAKATKEAETPDTGRRRSGRRTK